MNTAIRLRENVLINQEHVTAGAVVTVDTTLARYLVGVGKAEYVSTEQPVTVETATCEPISKAVMPKAKKRQG